MNTITVDPRAERIRTLHSEAQSMAAAAIDLAIEAGALLTAVKESVPHGEFGAWVETNCGFSDRTARRYMRVHAHRQSLPLGISVNGALAQLKTDTVSDLPPRILTKWTPEKIRPSLEPWPDLMGGAFTVLRFSGASEIDIASRTGFSADQVHCMLDEDVASRRFDNQLYTDSRLFFKSTWMRACHRIANTFAQREFPGQAAAHKTLHDMAELDVAKHFDAMASSIYDMPVFLLALADHRVALGIDKRSNRSTSDEIEFWAFQHAHADAA